MLNAFRLCLAIVLSVGLVSWTGVAGAGETADRTTAAANDSGIRVDDVVELFTSQGCSSCPPADHILTELSQRSDILALAYHVDYWDYIGWHDPLGSSDNTERQRDYAKAFSTTTIYTPQMVVNGVAGIVGSRADEIRRMLGASGLPPRGVDASVTLRKVGGRLHITADLEGLDPDAPMPVLVFVTYGGKTTTKVHSGENRGRTLVNTHPVRDWRILGMWQGQPMTIDLPADVVAKRAAGGTEGPSSDGTIVAAQGGGCAVLLQAVLPNGAPGRIMAADRMDF